MAADSILLRQAVRAALEQGFRHESADEEPEEINLVLQEREAAEKKAKAWAAGVASTWLDALASYASRSGKRSY